jgi:hypothetical protein
MAVSKTLLSPRPFSATGRQRAHPEPMDAEGVSFGARFALAGSVVDRDHAPRPQRRCGMAFASPKTSDDVLDGRLNRITGEALIHFLTDPMYEFHGRCRRAEPIFEKPHAQ